MTREYSTALILMVLGASAALAGAQPAPVTQPAPQKSLAATLDVYVFPTTGQTPGQQSTDEASCYTWAAENSGVDPFALQKQAQQQQQQAQQAQQATAEQMSNFKKAFSVCLEAKKYMVKY